MTSTLPSEAPNLKLAVSRLRRVLWGWAVLLAALGALHLTPLRSEPLSPSLLAAFPYLACAALLASGLQPSYLALVATVWGLSVILLVPSVGAVFGPDPLGVLLGASTLERIVIALVRILFMVTAWNQFLFYRMLYGSADFRGMAPPPPVIPPMVENRTDRMAEWSAMLGFLSVMTPILAMGLHGTGLSRPMLQGSLVLATFGLGAGLGAAFSPTNRRGTALRGMLLGGLGYLLTLAVGAVLRGLQPA